MKQKNGVEEYVEIRENLINLYLDINSLFQKIEHGGTYFGHQSYRILAYAEYNIYLYKYGIEKLYDISKQKELYIKSLRQLIKDEEYDENVDEIVNIIDKRITNIFYLRCAQEFQYKYYGFW